MTVPAMSQPTFLGVVNVKLMRDWHLNKERKSKIWLWRLVGRALLLRHNNESPGKTSFCI